MLANRSRPGGSGGAGRAGGHVGGRAVGRGGAGRPVPAAARQHHAGGMTPSTAASAPAGWNHTKTKPKPKRAPPPHLSGGRGKQRSRRRGAAAAPPPCKARPQTAAPHGTQRSRRAWQHAWHATNWAKPQQRAGGSSTSHPATGQNNKHPASRSKPPTSTPSQAPPCPGKTPPGPPSAQAPCAPAAQRGRRQDSGGARGAQRCVLGAAAPCTGLPRSGAAAAALPAAAAERSHQTQTPPILVPHTAHLPLLLRLQLLRRRKLLHLLGKLLVPLDLLLEHLALDDALRGRRLEEALRVLRAAGGGARRRRRRRLDKPHAQGASPAGSWLRHALPVMPGPPWAPMRSPSWSPLLASTPAAAAAGPARCCRMCRAVSRCWWRVPCCRALGLAGGAGAVRGGSDGRAAAVSVKYKPGGDDLRAWIADRRLPRRGVSCGSTGADSRSPKQGLQQLIIVA